MDTTTYTKPLGRAMTAPSGKMTTWQRVALGAILVIALAIPFTVKNFYIFQVTLALILAIAILGLNLLTGFNGQFSLGHSAFYAIGAYTTAILMENADVPLSLIHI